MCLSCGNLNFEKRTQICDLKGRVAMVTGARVKIGYQTALILLRNGATVIATSRFPHDTALRYSKVIIEENKEISLKFHIRNLILINGKIDCIFMV